jgi:outer membrane protein assembly factor BamA
MTTRKKLRRFICTAILIAAGTQLHAQAFKKLQRNLYVKDSARIADKKPLFLPFPVIGYAPETKFQYGFGAVYSFYLDKTSNITRPSSLYSYNMFTVESQIQLILQGSLWTKNNMWHMFVSGIYNDFPAYFYGIGAHTHEADKDLITAKRFSLLMGVERKLGKHFYAGGGLGFQSDHFTDQEKGGIFDTTAYVGKDGGKLAVIGYEAIYDSRDYENYTTKGTYVRAIGWTNFAYSDWHYTTITLDARHFLRINATQTLGFQGAYHTTQGSSIPFYAMAKLGGSSYLRGYYAWRYNDQNLLAMQTEYRYQPWAKKKDQGFISDTRIIFALFAGTGTVYANNGLTISDFFPSFGGGIRYMFDPLARLTLRLDMAVGNKKPGEDISKGLYISLNEAF